jgi:hypothetical protein
MILKRKHKNLITFFIIIALVLSVFSWGAYFFDAFLTNELHFSAPISANSMSAVNSSLSLLTLGAAALFSVVNSSGGKNAETIFKLSFDKNTKHLFKDFFDNSFSALLLIFGFFAFIYSSLNEKLIKNILDSDGGK